MTNSDPKPHQERWFYQFLYTAKSFAFFDWLYRLFGRRVFNFVAKWTGWFYAKTQLGVTQTVAENLALLTGQPPCVRSATEVFMNFGLTISDYIGAGNISAIEAHSWIAEAPDIDVIETTYHAGKGAILVTGHFGFFEFGANLLSQYRLPVSVITLAEPTPTFTQWRADFRARWGAQTIEIGHDSFASLEVVHALNSGRLCAMLVDRPYSPTQSQSITLPGGETSFSTSAALLARLADCPLIPVTVARGADRKYHLVTKPPIWVDKKLPRPEALQLATRAIADSLIEEFQKSPTQWFQFVSVRS